MSLRWQDRVSSWWSPKDLKDFEDDAYESELREWQRRRASDERRRSRPRVPVTSGVWIRDQDLHSELVRWFNQRIAEYWQKVNS